MEWLGSLFMGGSIAHSVFLLGLVIAVGIFLGRIKIGGVALGVTWILFVGIAASHFGMRINGELLHFIKEFGLILFVFSIGLQVGPGFFSAFKSDGIRLVALASSIVVLGVVTAYVIHLITGTPIPAMVGIMSGAVTNTPGLGAAQQAYQDAMPNAGDFSSIAQGYAVAYPLGVVGIILSLIIVRFAFRVNFKKEDEALEALHQNHSMAEKYSILFSNTTLDGYTIQQIRELLKRQFVISRICRTDNQMAIADGKSTLNIGDKLHLTCSLDDADAIIAFLGSTIEMSEEEWDNSNDTNNQLVSRRILITKENINGKRFADLRLRTRYGINITRVNRAGVDLIPYQGMELQIGDRVMVVGNQEAIDKVADVLGNSLKKLREPNLITIFLGIAMGVLLGSIPLLNIPQPVKLGLAGGPLIIAILMGRFGTHFHFVTYTTMSANLMLREMGIALFLAAVGIGAGDGFVATIVEGDGLKWVLYGVIITMLPILIVVTFARLKLKLNYYTLMGLVSGSLTDPPALAYSNATAGNDMPAVAYATVYPIVMFLRVILAQIFILFAL